MGLMVADWHSMGSAYTDAASTAVVASFGVAVQRRGGYFFLSLTHVHVYILYTCVGSLNYFHCHCNIQRACIRTTNTPCQHQTINMHLSIFQRITGGSGGGGLGIRPQRQSGEGGLAVQGRRHPGQAPQALPDNRRLTDH